jgi:short-subunit dehydrogenase
MAREGLRLALVARSAEPLERLAAELRAQGGDAQAFPADLADRGAIGPLVEAVMRRLGGLDALVLNAGVETFGHYERSSPETIAQTIDVNLTSPLLLLRAAMPQLQRVPDSQVVWLSSTAGFGPGTPYGLAYAASKAGLLSASHSLRMERPQGAPGSTAIIPGFVRGAGMHEVQKAQTGAQPSGALGTTTVEEVVEAVLRALRHNPPEIVCNSVPLRLSVALGKLTPGLAVAATRWLSADFMRKVADAREPEEAS